MTRCSGIQLAKLPTSSDVSDNAILKANLLKSPCLAGPRSPHEVLAIHDAPSAAAALNLAIDRLGERSRPPGRRWTQAARPRGDT